MTRSQKLCLGSRELHTPIFFPSISSVKTSLRPVEYTGILNALGTLNIQYLVSAYDLLKTTSEDSKILLDSLERANKNGISILMDSGNYESFWKNAKEKWTQDQFHRALSSFPAHFAFSFDDQSPPSDLDKHLKQLVAMYRRDQDVTQATTIIPIVHEAPSNLPVLCRKLVEATGVSAIAVAERRLGEGIIQRAKTVTEIRKHLDQSGKFVALHLLGTGNPISIATYTIAGADSFDGLEWCQTVVDHKSSLLFHLSQADFVLDQTSWGKEEQPFQIKALAHNLTFYSSWIKNLRDAAATKESLVAFCQSRFPPHIFEKLSSEFSWRKNI